MSTIAEICIRQNEATRRVMSIGGAVGELLRDLRLTVHEAILDLWDEPQLLAMDDDGCPNHSSTGPTDV